VQKGRTSAIYSGDGKLIGYIHSENVRQPISGGEIPKVLKNATVSIEDKNFWEHGALDAAGIARAAWKDLLAGGKPVQGASTITQQLVRNLYIRHPEETLKRKIKEAALAEELFEKHSRRWILNTYLNTAPYGTNEGQTALGVEAASRRGRTRRLRHLHHETGIEAGHGLARVAARVAERPSPADVDVGVAMCVPEQP